jgi:hypothetical protein
MRTNGFFCICGSEWHDLHNMSELQAAENVYGRQSYPNMLPEKVSITATDLALVRFCNVWGECLHFYGCLCFQRVSATI